MYSPGFQRDFKYRELLEGEKGVQVVKGIFDIRSKCLREYAAAFAVNISRTATFAKLPSELAFMASSSQWILDNAIFVKTGKPVDFRNPCPELAHDPTYLDDSTGEIARQANQFWDSPVEEQEITKERLGVRYVEKLLGHSNILMSESIDALYAAIVMTSWTAFECLASDVWPEAVNRGPAEFRIKVQEKLEPEKKKRGHEKTAPRRIDPLIDFARSVQESRRGSFQVLWKLKRNYSVILGTAATKRIFDKPADGYLAALSATRNLLAHKSGTVDPDFVRQVQKFPELKGFHVGEPLLLDGGIVARLRNAAAYAGMELLNYIDQILTPRINAP